MTQPNVMTIDPSRRILTGESVGQSVRSELGLDAEDVRDGPAVVRIDTPIVTSSFIKGLLEPSVRSLGLERFKQKYDFAAPRDVREGILAQAQLVADQV